MAEKLRSLLQRAETWITGGYTQDPASPQSAPSSPPLAVRTLSEHEVTSMKIKQFLEQREFDQCVNLIRQKPHDYLTACLEKMPFLAMNRMVPDSLPVWEALLSRLHTREDRYIPQFPYSACDALVLHIGRVLHECEQKADETAELRQQCRFVLKKVYMLYEDVLNKVCHSHDQVSSALCSLMRHHSLMGHDASVKTIQERIKEEIDASVHDYREASHQLQEIFQKEVIPLSEGQQHGETPENGRWMDSTSNSTSMVQVQERLYLNQSILCTLQPTKRKGNLSELSGLLLDRINGDKVVLQVIAQMRMRDPTLSADEPVESHLRARLRQLDLTISLLKDIEQELQITVPRQSTNSSMLDHSDIPVSSVSACSEEGTVGLQAKRTSSGVFPDVGSDCEEVQQRVRSSSVGHPVIRAPSARDHPFGSPHPSRLHCRRCSFSESIRSTESTGSIHGGNLAMVRNDVVKDQRRFSSPSGPPGGRTWSNPNLLSNSPPSGSGALLAGVRTSLMSPSSQHSLINNLGPFSRSLGNINIAASVSGTLGSRKKPWSWTASPTSLVFENGASAVSSGGGGVRSANVELEMRLLQTQDMVYHLRQRERELMDRLSEQAQKQLEVSSKFEDISLGPHRPSQIVQRYEELFSQGRMDALDFLEGQHMDTQFCNQFLMDILQTSYRTAQQELNRMQRGWREALGVSEQNQLDAPFVGHLQSAISLFLRKTSNRRDLSNVVKMVTTHLWEKYHNLSSLQEIRESAQVVTFIRDCVQISWDMCVQVPPLVLNCSEEVFDAAHHQRCYLAKRNADVIIAYSWPTLVQAPAGPVLYKGRVIT